MVSLVSLIQDSPGYMDAEYYFATGQQLAKAEGFTEPFIWNYLDDPQGVPHSSHTYWMPLASMIAAVGMFVTSSLNFSSARLGFLLLAGLIPPLTAAIAHAISQRRSAAYLAGLLAVFSVFYLPFLPTTDTFGLYMVLGGGFFFILMHENARLLHYLILGLIVGLMHLARADGVLWLPIAIFASIYLNRSHSHLTPIATRIVLVCIGYLVIMTPWFMRNQLTFGSLLSPASIKALWFKGYDELFAFPAERLTFTRWWGTGIVEILRVRFWALGQNLQSFMAVQGAIFLTPLILLGGWQLRREKRVQFGILAWMMTLGSMTVVFPFAGARGGYFHSGAALQPLFWSLAVVGLDVFLSWGKRVRRWDLKQARLIFSFALVGLALGLSLFIVNQRFLRTGAWDESHQKYLLLEEELQALGASPNDEVLVNNPPGFYLASGRQSLSIPEGAPQTLLAVAQRYHVEYIILEYNHSPSLNALYSEPEKSEALELLWSDGDTHILRVLDSHD